MQTRVHALICRLKTNKQLECSCIYAYRGFIVIKCRQTTKLLMYVGFPSAYWVRTLGYVSLHSDNVNMDANNFDSCDK